MTNLQERSAAARIFALIVLLAIIPAWFFYIGTQYEKTVQVLTSQSAEVTEALK